MYIRRAEPDDMPEMFRLYTNATAQLVHGFAATVEEFTHAFRAAPRHMRAHEVFVASARSCGWPINGFLRAGVFRQVSDRWSFASNGHGLLFGPFAEIDSPAVSDALLEAAQRWIAARGASRCVAFDPVEAASVPFYNGGWCGLSERLPHVLGAFARAGFRIEHRELCMARPDLPIPSHGSPGRLELISDCNAGRRNAVRLWDRGSIVGSCFYSRMYPTRSGRPQAEHTGYIDGLDVAPAYQGRGLGRLLILAALHRLRELDCGAVCLTTSAANLRAQNLYYSLDFALTDTCVTLSCPVAARELSRRG